MGGKEQSVGVADCSEGSQQCLRLVAGSLRALVTPLGRSRGADCGDHVTAVRAKNARGACGLPRQPAQRSSTSLGTARDAISWLKTASRVLTRFFT